MNEPRKQTCPSNGDEVRHMFVIGQPWCLCGERRSPDMGFWNNAARIETVYERSVPIEIGSRVTLYGNTD